MSDFFRRGLAEFVGAFALVFVGGGSVHMFAQGGLVGIALAHGLVIAVMVSAVGHISGGHFNPAITLGFLVTRRIAPVLALVYLVAQLGGAVLAAGALHLSLPGIADFDNTVPTLDDSVEPLAGMFTEAVLTFFLIWVVFATAVDPRGAFKAIAGLAIGLTITFGILMGGLLTGAAMNPARAFGPQLVEMLWTDAWVYYAGPLLGGAVAALLYEFAFLRPVGPSVVGTPESGIAEPRPGDAALD